MNRLCILPAPRILWSNNTIMGTKLLSVAFALSALATQAQTMGEIRGRVTDPEKQAVPYATVVVQLPTGEMRTDADEEGRYVLKPVPTGTYVVRALAAGSEEATVAGVPVNPDRFTKVDIVLHPVVKELKGHKVKAKKSYSSIYTKPLIDIDDPSRQTLLAVEFAKDPNIKTPAKFIGSSFAGVQKQPNGEGLYFRGSRTENMVTFLDGVKVSGSVPRVPSSGISSITVYTGGLPAKYGDVTGGVVVIETKTYQELWAQQRAAEYRAMVEAQQALEEQAAPTLEQSLD